MSTNLERFKTRRKVNSELAQRYEHDASYYGDKNIKNELASAKRTATSLAKASAAFSYLRPEQKLALDAATSAMRSLARDLAELALWAKDYAIFCTSEREREEIEKLEKLAEKRWNNDVAALNFEASILSELQTNDGKHALGDWFHGRGLHKDVPRNDFSLSFDLCPPKKNYSNRLNTAAILVGIDHTRPQKSNAYSRTGSYWYVCGWQDYEEYLAWRKSVAVTAESALAKLSLIV